MDIGLSAEEFERLPPERFLALWDRARYLQHQQAVLAALPAVAIINVYSRRRTPVTPEDLVGKFRPLVPQEPDGEQIKRKLQAAALVLRSLNRG